MSQKLDLGENSFFNRESEVFKRELKAARLYPELGWRWNNDKPSLSGMYEFSAQKNGLILSDVFNLNFSFPLDYPKHIPSVIEKDGKIPNSFHRNPDSGLCLGTHVELYQSFCKNPTLQHFIDNILNPYLYQWLYYQKNGHVLWGERKHGREGIIQGYSRFLQTTNLEAIATLLTMAMIDELSSNLPCPCQSGKRVKFCHRKQVECILSFLPADQVFCDIKMLRGIK